MKITAGEECLIVNKKVGSSEDKTRKERVELEVFQQRQHSLRNSNAMTLFSPLLAAKSLLASNVSGNSFAGLAVAPS